MECHHLRLTTLVCFMLFLGACAQNITKESQTCDELQCENNNVCFMSFKQENQTSAATCLCRGKWAGKTCSDSIFVTVQSLRQHRVSLNLDVFAPRKGRPKISLEDSKLSAVSISAWKLNDSTRCSLWTRKRAGDVITVLGLEKSQEYILCIANGIVDSCALYGNNPENLTYESNCVQISTSSANPVPLDIGFIIIPCVVFAFVVFIIIFCHLKRHSLCVQFLLNCCCCRNCYCCRKKTKKRKYINTKKREVSGDLLMPPDTDNEDSKDNKKHSNAVRTSYLETLYDNSSKDYDVVMRNKETSATKNQPSGVAVTYLDEDLQPLYIPKAEVSRHEEPKYLRSQSLRNSGERNGYARQVNPVVLDSISNRNTSGENTNNPMVNSVVMDIHGHPQAPYIHYEQQIAVENQDKAQLRTKSNPLNRNVSSASDKVDFIGQRPFSYTEPLDMESASARNISIPVVPHVNQDLHNHSRRKSAFSEPGDPDGNLVRPLSIHSVSSTLSPKIITNVDRGIKGDARSVQTEHNAFKPITKLNNSKEYESPYKTPNVQIGGDKNDIDKNSHYQRIKPKNIKFTEDNNNTSYSPSSFQYGSLTRDGKLPNRGRPDSNLSKSFHFGTLPRNKKPNLDEKWDRMTRELATQALNLPADDNRSNSVSESGKPKKHGGNLSGLLDNKSSRKSKVHRNDDSDSEFLDLRSPLAEDRDLLNKKYRPSSSASVKSDRSQRSSSSLSNKFITDPIFQGHPSDHVVPPMITDDEEEEEDNNDDTISESLSFTFPDPVPSPLTLIGNTDSIISSYDEDSRNLVTPFHSENYSSSSSSSSSNSSSPVSSIKGSRDTLRADDSPTFDQRREREPGVRTPVSGGVHTQV